MMTTGNRWVFQRGLLLLICGISILAIGGKESEARCRLFRRRCQPQCIASGAYAPAYGTAVCPVYPVGPAGMGLWMYYACEWSPTGCNANPQPLYLNQQNAQGCPSDLTQPGHNCVQLSRGGKDYGCENGFQGPCPPRFIEDTNACEIQYDFTGYFESNSQKLQIHFYKVRLNVNGAIFGLGFEDKNGDFAKRDEPIRCCGKKGFDVEIADTTAPGGKLNYRVLLHKTGGSVCP